MVLWGEGGGLFDGLRARRRSPSYSSYGPPPPFLFFLRRASYEDTFSGISDPICHKIYYRFGHVLSTHLL